MIKFAFDKTGGFIICSEQGNWAYAYPTSPHADNAKKNPTHVASVMARAVDRAADIYPFMTERNRRLSHAYDAAQKESRSARKTCAEQEH